MQRSGLGVRRGQNRFRYQPLGSVVFDQERIRVVGLVSEAAAAGRALSGRVGTVRVYLPVRASTSVSLECETRNRPYGRKASFVSTRWNSLLTMADPFPDRKSGVS